MSYQSSLGRAPIHRTGRGGYVGMGSAAGDAVTSAAAIIQDPALPKVLQLIVQLNKIEAASSGKSGTSAGVGLSTIVLPLRGYVYAKQNPWVLPLGVAALLGIPMALGYTLGKRSK